MAITVLLKHVEEALVRRAVDSRKTAVLLETSRSINYYALCTGSDIRKVEDDLEESKVFDLLQTLRSYVVFEISLAGTIDWWTVVDRFGASISMASSPKTVNRVDKAEYLRMDDIGNRQKYIVDMSGLPSRSEQGGSLLRANDWVVILWLLSFVPINILTTLPKIPKEPVD